MKASLLRIKSKNMNEVKDEKWRRFGNRDDHDDDENHLE